MKWKSIYLGFVAVLLLGACHKALVPALSGSRHYSVSVLKGDSALEGLVTPYKIQMEAAMQEVLGKTDTILYKKQPESTLGNFIADAMVQKARTINDRVDAAVMNYGGIRVSYIQPGVITAKQMYELMPFDNMLCIVAMNGAELKTFCNHMAALKGWPVSGIVYEITKDGKANHIMINGQTLNEGKVYYIATNDYVAAGGDNCSFLKPLKKEQTNIFIRDVLMGYVKELNGKPLHPYIEKRVSNAE
jgi:2',3'-cyclic-nucleotide 2'-phosphodiesterase (5'-nucleotidase family)